MNALKAYPWPGNVRELQNRIQRSSILSDNHIGGNELNQTYQSKKIATSDLLKIPFNIL